MMPRYIDMAAKAEITADQLTGASQQTKGDGILPSPSLKFQFPTNLSEEQRAAVMEQLRKLGILRESPSVSTADSSI